MRRFTFLAALFALAVTGGATRAHAAWLAGGTPVCSAASLQYVPAAIPDGAGGSIVVWEDERSGQSDIYCQRWTRAGAPTPGWPVQGLAVCTATGAQTAPRLCSDGAGGAIIAWTDGTTLGDIYAQHVTGDGHIATGWPAAGSQGLAVCTETHRQQSPRLASDGAGGAFITWTDSRSAGANDIAVQHVLAAGSVDARWPVNGIDPFVGDHSTETTPVIVPDAAGGCWLAWSDDRAAQSNTSNGFDIEYVHLNAAGVASPAGTGSGIPACNAIYDQQNPTIASDGVGGILVAWRDGRLSRSGGSDDIYAQRANPSSPEASGWPPYETARAITTSAGEQDQPFIVSDAAGGAVVLWRDQASGTAQIEALRVLGSSAIAPGWPAGGVPVCNVISVKSEHVAVPNDSGGCVVVWRDERGADGDLYAMRLRGDGTISPGWPAAGLAVCTGTGDVQNPALIPDDHGGAFVFWQDMRSDVGDIYSAHVTTSGDAAPTANVSPTPEAFSLRMLGANPSFGSVEFALELPAASPAVSVRIVDVGGRQVRALAPNLAMGAGSHALHWDGLDAAGQRAAAGLYFAEVSTGGVIARVRFTRL